MSKVGKIKACLFTYMYSIMILILLLIFAYVYKIDKHIISIINNKCNLFISQETRGISKNETKNETKNKSKGISEADDVSEVSETYDVSEVSEADEVSEKVETKEVNETGRTDETNEVSKGEKIASTTGYLDIKAVIDACPEGWTMIDSDLNQNCSGDTLPLCANIGTADNGLTEIEIIRGKNSHCSNPKAKKQTQDLKSGTGRKTPSLFLCNTYGVDSYIQDVKINTNKNFDDGYKVLPTDLERGCGKSAPFKYLAYK